MVLLQPRHTSMITLQSRKVQLLEPMAGQGLPYLESPSAGMQPLSEDGRFRSHALVDEAPTFQVAEWISRADVSS